jgi:Carboxypeptidase regulatory-like domain/TonB dependent receptor
MRRIYFLIAVIAMALLVSVTFAQTTSGDLVGTVKDPSGAIIPNANVTVTNQATGVAISMKSGSAGEFRASNLLPGQYDLAVSSAGFEPYTLHGITVELNKASTTNVTLSVGANTTVEVAAEAGVALDTTTTNLTQTFSNTELTDLPSTSSGGSTGFGVLNASLLSPGVASSGGIGIGIGPSIGGQRPRNNNFTIEGIDNNNKAVTGPLVYIPNDSVQGFTLITNQFSPEFGHSSGGQFNTNVISGTNKFHGRVYEYFQNRNLNAISGTQGGKPAINPRFDDNRYGAQMGGPILRDKLFFFANFERNSIGQNPAIFSCVPTAAGLNILKGLGATYGLNANNVAQYLQYTPAATVTGSGGAPIDASADVACGNSKSGPQFLQVYQGTAFDKPSGIYGGGSAFTNIPLGNYQATASTPSNFNVLTTSMDYTLSAKDSIRGRYIYNTLNSVDNAVNTVPFPVFNTLQPFHYHLVALSEYHTFTPNLTNEFRVGFNRYENEVTSGNFSYPGLDQFPNLVFNDQGAVNLGPDPNAPQFTIQNLYQVTDNINYVKGKHTITIGFDGRKYISPQGFTQRARGDYEWNNLTEFLHDLAPTSFGERSTGNLTYYGDQTALYGYVNDTWRMTPKITINGGLRYEFTSVPAGERTQALNSLASVPGLITFAKPQPAYKSFAPRLGINWAPDEKTSVRAGFGLAYDVLFDNLGTLSFPPQLSATNDVGNAGNPQPGDPNFLKNGGLPPGKGGIAQFCISGTGPGTNLPCSPDLVTQRETTAAFIPNQVVPYAETYTLTVQRTFAKNYTAEIGYIGTRGIHLPTQIQLNVQPRVTAANQLPTLLSGSTTVTAPAGANTLGAIENLSNILPAFNTNNFTSKITSYQPYSQSNYNAFVANVTRRFIDGLQANLSYTWSKTMDDATAEVFSTTLTPRRPQDSQNVNADYSRSALDRTHRISLEAVYDLQLYKHSNSFVMRNVVGNWTIAPIYTYESPEYATVLSDTNANLNGDSTAISRTIINSNGKKGTATTVVPQFASNLANLCQPSDNGQCDNNTVGYVALDPNAYYIQAGAGTLPNSARNTLPTRPTNNIDLSAFKRLTFHEHYSFEFGAQAYNVLNHAQYTPGTVGNINQTSNTTSVINFQKVDNAFFNQPGKVFANNARTMQLSGKFFF